MPVSLPSSAGPVLPCIFALFFDNISDIDFPFPAPFMQAFHLITLRGQARRFTERPEFFTHSVLRGSSVAKVFTLDNFPLRNAVSLKTHYYECL